MLPEQFRRGLYEQIDWKARAICIEGPRGSGKSTLMLQHIKLRLAIEETLFVSLDDLYFQEHTLVEVADEFYRQGGRYLFIDEVHKYTNWQQEVKNLYDFMPDLQLVISGSFILALQESKVDLSRRLLHYTLAELSLREYISLKDNIKLPTFTLEEILSKPNTLVDRVMQKISSPLKEFERYLTFGAYPFFKEGEEEFLRRISQLINVIIDYDLPEARTIQTTTQAKLKKLLYILSTSVPFKPNIAKLTTQLQTSRTRLLEMLNLLEKAQLLYTLRAATQGVSLMNKPEKIYLRNTSLIMALAEEQPNKGNLRETFFLAQLTNAGYQVTYPKKADFRINHRYLIEVGGKTKTRKQIAGEEEAFIAADQIEYGYKETIPLWLFGFLY